MGTTESRTTPPPHASGAMLWKASRLGDVNKVRAILLHPDAAIFVNWTHPEHGTTPLMMASLCGKHKLVSMLLERGAGVNVRDRAGGNTALHFAAAKNKVGVVEKLLSANCDAHIWNDDGLAAIDLARFAGQREVALLLSRRFVTAKGFLYVKKGHSVFTQWKKQWCMLLECTTDQSCLELAMYKEPDDVKPTKVLLLSAAATAVSPTSSSRHVRKHTFHFTPNATIQRYQRDAFSRSESIRGRRHLPSYSANGVRFATETEDGRRQWVELLGPLAFTPLPPRMDNVPQRSSNNNSIETTLEDQKQDMRCYNVGPEPCPEVRPSAPPLELGAFEANNDCVICMDQPRAAVVVPCGHLAGCYPCLQEHQRKATGCPICRTPIATVVRVFTC
ncbi:hypothetical protein SDRG_03834 [Saprolegnia diclina VS20]|uniref:RING-type domain-containing protein n=1 Tax=Saprolegnia diclina (strain VS20) TaxID=1156394 RepID=T0QW21_SAPDV|nr:hypothetical protein SDRG_03834 [Saprolegnia diclina VS20]EQC38876.1 hypothetical protein SDRG_03834 [Saprolegnia diclina VS20]|eukprot:XP_008607700.1 hypothetical protein SDRG_03834 [Saprolegnia diclina VS20]